MLGRFRGPRKTAPETEEARTREAETFAVAAAALRGAIRAKEAGSLRMD
jgi:hypothetical protein